MAGRVVGATHETDGYKSGDLTRIDRTSAAVVQEAHGKYYESVKRGRVFIGSNAITGLAIPIYSGKANAMTLWNPAGSGYDLVLLATYLGLYSTNTVLGSLVYVYHTSAGTGIATAGTFLTATLATPVNAYIGGGNSSVALFSPAVNTTTANGTILRTLGLSAAAFAVATTTAAPFTMVDYADGNIIIPPDTAIQIMGSTAMAGVYNQTFVWEEVPV